MRFQAAPSHPGGVAENAFSQFEDITVTLGSPKRHTAARECNSRDVREYEGKEAVKSCGCEQRRPTLFFSTFQ